MQNYVFTASVSLTRQHIKLKYVKFLNTEKIIVALQTRQTPATAAFYQFIFYQIKFLKGQNEQGGQPHNCKQCEYIALRLLSR